MENKEPVVTVETPAPKKRGPKPGSKRVCLKNEALPGTCEATNDIKFDKFVDELKERFGNFGMNKSSYGDDFIHAKVDTLIYLLIKKGVITMPDLIGCRNSNNQLEGGYIAEYLFNLKTLVDARR